MSIDTWIFIGISAVAIIKTVLSMKKEKEKQAQRRSECFGQGAEADNAEADNAEVERREIESSWKQVFSEMEQRGSQEAPIEEVVVFQEDLLQTKKVKETYSPLLSMAPTSLVTMKSSILFPEDSSDKDEPSSIRDIPVLTDFCLEKAIVYDAIMHPKAWEYTSDKF